MLEKALKSLEYDKIRATLAEKTQCCVGRELAAGLSPAFQREDVTSSLELTAEAESILLRDGRSPVENFPDMRPNLKRAHARCV